MIKTITDESSGTTIKAEISGNDEALEIFLGNDEEGTENAIVQIVIEDGIPVVNIFYNASDVINPQSILRFLLNKLVLLSFQ